MNRDDAIVVVEAMFHANGRDASAKVVAELAREVERAGCSTCAKTVIERAHDDGPALTVPMFRSTYARETSAPNHGLHLGQDDRAIDVGKVEAERRTTDVAALVAAGMEPRRAQVAAAMRWANRIDVGEDLDIAAWTRHTPPTILERTITAAWAYGRACATQEPGRMTDEEWADVVGPWRKAWLEASHA